MAQGEEMMADYGVSELLLLIAIATGTTGFELGMPPRAEDPVLSQIAPAECIYYARHAGMDPPRRDAPHPTERLLANPEVQQFTRAVQANLVRHYLPHEVVGGNNQEDSNESPLLLSLLQTQPAACYISKLQLNPRETSEGIGVGPFSVRMEGGLVIGLQQAPEKLIPACTELLRRLPGEQSEVQRGDQKLTRIVFQDTSHEIIHGIYENYLILASSLDEFSEILTRFSRDPQDWMQRAEKAHVYPRRSTLAFLNLQELLRAVGPMIPPGWDFANIGVDSWEACVVSTGWHDANVASRLEIRTREGSKALDLFRQQQIDHQALSQVPEDAMLVMSVAFDRARAWEWWESAIRSTSPDVWSQFIRADAVVRARAQLSLRDFQACLGNQLTIRACARDGGVITGWLAELEVRDHAKLLNLEKNFRRWISQVPNGAGPTLQDLALEEGNVTMMKIPGAWFEPTWSLEPDRMYFSLFPQPLITRLKQFKIQSGAGPRQFWFAELLPESEIVESKSPFFVSFFQMARTTEQLLPLMQLALASQGLQRAFAQNGQGRGVPAPAGGAFPMIPRLPSAADLFPERSPCITTGYVRGNSILFEWRGILPQGNLLTTIPIAFTLGMPAAQRAQSRHDQALSNQNLRRIMLAALNFESALRRLPACSIDNNGRPQLSWRVAILPYLDEQALYEEFHLNEPWDSPHNQKLIGRMPNIFRAPGSEVDDGKTNYLGVAGESGVFAVPQPNRPGTRLADIRDGTSRTVAVVEVADELAAIWTKPDDFVPDPDDVSRGLAGNRGDVFLAAFADGHVQSISLSVPAESLKGIFTKAGGEAITLP